MGKRLGGLWDGRNVVLKLDRARNYLIIDELLDELLPNIDMIDKTFDLLLKKIDYSDGDFDCILDTSDDVPYFD